MSTTNLSHNYIRQYRKKAILQPMSQSTSLVNWGKNLTSSLGMGRFTKQESNMIQLTSSLKSVIFALLLSDGWLAYPSKTSKNARLGFMQSYNHSEYLWFVFFMLSHYCSSYPLFRKRTRFGKVGYSLEFTGTVLFNWVILFILSKMDRD